MIVNFEEITQELNEKEKLLIPILLQGFKKRTKENPITEPEICEKVNKHIINGYYGTILKHPIMMLNGARLRKCVNFIRSNGLLPLIATSNGYYVSYDPEEINKQIKSLEQRARSIQKCAEGLKKFIQ